MSTVSEYHVVLIGDSTLDNVVWVASSELAVAPQLVIQLKKQISFESKPKVSNLAADGFTSSNILEGGTPCLSYRARLEACDPFPPSVNGALSHFHPLEELNNLSEISHTVISVGGNDIRHILSDMTSLPLVISKFHSNYERILATVNCMCPRSVIVLQYRPSFCQELGNYGVYQAIDTIPGPGTSVDKINRLMQIIYQPIFALARQYKMPIIDLPNSFDIHHSELYTCQIEPSGFGAKFIAELIAYAIANHDYTSHSKLYSKLISPSITNVTENDVVVIENDEFLDWKVTI